MYINTEGLAEIRSVLWKKPTLGRLRMAAWIAPLFAAIRLAASTFRALDHVLYPRFRRQAVEKPVFVFANPRSGTTLTHRLVSMDDDEFTTVKLYQTLLPSVTATRAFRALIELAKTPAGGLLRRLYALVNRPIERRWRDVHRLGLDQAEEDVATQLWSLQSPATGLLFPFMDDLRSQTWLDEQPADRRRAFMDSYESTLRRHVFEAGGKRFLNKNVFFAGLVRSVYARFPDASFVYIVRDPTESLPSFLHMFYRAWQAHSPGIAPDGEEIRALKRLGYDFLRTVLAYRREIPSDQFIVIRYEDLVRDPRSTILGLYDRLGMPVSPALEARLVAATEAQRAWKSSRKVDLAYFGITEAEVYDELRDVYAAFGYAPPAGATLERDSDTARDRLPSVA